MTAVDRSSVGCLGKYRGWKAESLILGDAGSQQRCVGIVAAGNQPQVRQPYEQSSWRYDGLAHRRLADEVAGCTQSCSPLCVSNRNLDESLLISMIYHVQRIWC